MYTSGNGCCKLRTYWGQYGLCLTFADEGYVADPLLYCTSYLVSPVVDYHMWYKGEKYQLICRMDGS